VGDSQDTSNESPSARGTPESPPNAQVAQSTPDTVTLLDIVAVLATRWKLIFFTTFFAAVGIVLFSIYTVRMPADSRFNPMPNYYRPEAQILLTDPQSDSGIAGALGSSDLGILAGLAGAGGGQGEASAALAETLLNGRQTIDQIIEQFGLLQLYADADFPRDAARKAVRAAMGSEFDDLSGVLTVSYEDVDPEFATRALEQLVELLETRFNALTRDDARSRTVAIDAQLSQLEDDLNNARQAITDFQRRYGVIDPSSQGQQTMELVGQFRAQKFDLQIQRETLLQIVASEDDPQILRIDRQIDLLDELIGELETGFHVYSPISIPMDQIASLTAQFTDLRRDLALKEQIYSTFQAELMRAQITSQDTTPRFQVIEPPEVPEVKAGPSRGLLCMIVTVAAFLISIFTAFIVEYFARAAHDPGESYKVELIREQFRFRRRRKQ